MPDSMTNENRHYFLKNIDFFSGFNSHACFQLYKLKKKKEFDFLNRINSMFYYQNLELFELRYS
jgi:hypothetical protein